MLPIIAIIGQPNVGKSTLFNRLTKSRDAIVVDMPGVTRDRQYGEGKVGDRPYIVIDTGGMMGDEVGIDSHMRAQAQLAIAEADVILFLVDGRAGISAADNAIAEQLRTLNKIFFLIVNKTDGIDEQMALADVYQLGLSQTPIAIAASHGRGVSQLMEQVCEKLPVVAVAEESQQKGIRVAIVGRPNVGKSTLTNRILGEQRVVVYDQPGTTRDSIELPFTRRGNEYTLIDTAGVRRRGRIKETVEKFSVVKTLQSITDANVVVVVLDGQETISEQDLHLIAFVVDAGKALVLAINKWDGLSEQQREHIKNEIDRRLHFVDFARRYFISALHGTGVGKLYDAIDEAYQSATNPLSTASLNTILEQAVHTSLPPLVNGRRTKLRYAHVGGYNPPTIVIHGNLTDKLPGHYQRYLNNYFRKTLAIVGTPLKLVFKTGENPFEGRKNKLTARQQTKRQRLLKHVRKKKSS